MLGAERNRSSSGPLGRDLAAVGRARVSHARGRLLLRYRFVGTADEPFKAIPPILARGDDGPVHPRVSERGSPRRSMSARTIASLCSASWTEYTRVSVPSLQVTEIEEAHGARAHRRTGRGARPPSRRGCDGACGSWRCRGRHRGVFHLARGRPARRRITRHGPRGRRRARERLPRIRAPLAGVSRDRPSRRREVVS